MNEEIKSQLEELEQTTDNNLKAVNDFDHSFNSVEIVGIDTKDNLPPLKPEIMKGVLRQGAKLILTGDSKAGKTFLLIELAISFAFGRQWCGLSCETSRVLYVNLELEQAEFRHRFRSVLDKFGRTESVDEGLIGTLNLRGKVSSAKDLVDDLIRRLDESSYDVVIIDPVYKVQDGDENSAEAISNLVKQLDRLAEATKCTIIYSHHHPKGSQNHWASIDRGAGSGVFSRDADAIIDLMELASDDDESRVHGAPFRMEFDLRSFPFHPSVDIWFKDGIHAIDSDGILKGRNYASTSRHGGSHSDQTDSKLKCIEDALDALMGEHDEIPAKEFIDKINEKGGDYYIDGCKDNRVLKTYIDRSDRFDWTNPSPSLAVIKRRPENQ